MFRRLSLSPFNVRFPRATCSCYHSVRQCTAPCCWSDLPHRHVLFRCKLNFLVEVTVEVMANFVP